MEENQQYESLTNDYNNEIQELFQDIDRLVDDLEQQQKQKFNKEVLASMALAYMCILTSFFRPYRRALKVYNTFDNYKQDDPESCTRPASPGQNKFVVPLEWIMDID